MATFFVGITWNRGAVSCEQMPNKKITGESFGDLVRPKFLRQFEKVINLDKRLVFQDGCLVQNKGHKGIEWCRLYNIQDHPA